MGWAEQKFEKIDLGEPRLNRRAMLLVERFGVKTRREHSPGVRKLGRDCDGLPLPAQRAGHTNPDRERTKARDRSLNSLGS